jgi:hypothetical protein
MLCLVDMSKMLILQNVVWKTGILLKGEIQWLGKFHLYDKYCPCEVWENNFFHFFPPWFEEFNFRIKLLHSFKYNPWPLHFTQVDTLWPPSVQPTVSLSTPQAWVYSKRLQVVHCWGHGLYLKEYQSWIRKLNSEHQGAKNWKIFFSHTSHGQYLSYEWNLPDHCISPLITCQLAQYQVSSKLKFLIILFRYFPLTIQRV